jgi:hypothetical protein
MKIGGNFGKCVKCKGGKMEDGGKAKKNPVEEWKASKGQSKQEVKKNLLGGKIDSKTIAAAAEKYAKGGKACKGKSKLFTPKNKAVVGTK